MYLEREINNIVERVILELEEEPQRYNINVEVINDIYLIIYIEDTQTTKKLVITEFVERIEENNFFYIIITEALKKMKAAWYKKKI